MFVHFTLHVVVQGSLIDEAYKMGVKIFAGIENLQVSTIWKMKEKEYAECPSPAPGDRQLELPRVH